MGKCFHGSFDCPLNFVLVWNSFRKVKLNRLPKWQARIFDELCMLLLLAWIRFQISLGKHECWALHFLWTCSCLHLQDCQNRAKSKFALRSLLVVPFQRVLKYPLLIQVSYTPKWSVQNTTASWMTIVLSFVFNVGAEQADQSRTYRQGRPSKGSCSCAGIECLSFNLKPNQLNRKGSWVDFLLTLQNHCGEIIPYRCIRPGWY